MSHAPNESTDETAREIERLREEVSTLQNQRVEEWVRLIRFGAVVPRSIEESLSWKLTRPIRLAQTAVGVFKRDGANQFFATVRSRVRRMVTRQ